MSIRKEWTRTVRFATVVCLASTAASFLATGIARGGERQFLVILATSPKQYPGPIRDPLGYPTGGLMSKQLIHNQYFDAIDGSIGSFAEYWEEISYGDVTISGTVTDWINLPWAIQPPLVNPERDSDAAALNDDLDDLAIRNSPAHFYDLNETGQYEYGAGERFYNWLASTIIDDDGDQGNSDTDNGPFLVGPGSFHTTEAPFYYPVWKPGERFVDMDEDGRWDALDEAANQMDWQGDGTPDLRGPWVDLDQNGDADNSGDCLYLPDSDNDGNPDCCPDGPGTPGCERYNPDGANSSDYQQPCPAMNWTGPNGEVLDCNGNLIPDQCDVSCDSRECRRTGWLDNPMTTTNVVCVRNADCDMALGYSCDTIIRRCRLCGASQDHLPFNPVGEDCREGPGDGFPDECQYESLADCAEQIDPEDLEDPCVTQGFEECNPQRFPRADSQNQDTRCEFDDFNGNDDLDIVEPFENFLRRWDACVFAPEAAAGNSEAANAHWVKVYDPSSPIADVEIPCFTEGRSFSYGDDSYIRDNYPGRAKLCSGSRGPCDTSNDCPIGETCRSGVEDLIEQARQTAIFGQHDPYGKLDDICLCLGVDCSSNADCADLPGSVCRGKETCGYTNPCPIGSECRDPDPSDNDNHKYCTGMTHCTCTITFLPDMTPLESTCVAGYHVQFDPPDRWANTVAINGPGEEEVYTTKMRAAPYTGGASGLLYEVTPKPGTYVSPRTGQLMDDPWYDQAWEDRYNARSCVNPEIYEDNPDPQTPLYIPCACENPDFNPNLPESGQNPKTIHCDPPPWPGESVGGMVRNIPIMVPFDDVDPDVYEAAVNRRFFKANRGGLNGNGTGWIGCDGQKDPGVVFEIGDVNGFGFEELCDAPILPEQIDGPDDVGIFYDGWVEHDDLASSKYHRAGDQRLGEVTSPYLSTYEYHPPGSDPLDPPDAIDVQAIWGEDRGDGHPGGGWSDYILPAAGPYAQDIHGNHHRDAGNVLTMELLTWRTEPPFNNGAAWEIDLLFEGTWATRFHPYAGPSFGPNLGFRDYNLDGLVDQGECRHPGSENYQADSVLGTSNNGVNGQYPFNRNRLMEDCVEALDQLVDFDDWVDPVAMDRITCIPGLGNWTLSDRLPGNFLDLNNYSSVSNRIRPNGVLSGVVVLPYRAHHGEDFGHRPWYYPIHNEDGNDTADVFPAYSPQISWNVFFHNYVWRLPIPGDSDETQAGLTSHTAWSARQYMRAWEDFPDLYDYDVHEPDPQPLINCPVASWDIMGSNDTEDVSPILVHPTPILKEKLCTEWVSPIDLTTVLTPGVTTSLTLPRAEFVRDSYYYLENENWLGERYYFWSAGSGFDERMPGPGMLVLHTDVGSNPEALPPMNVNGTRFTYHIVQADGLGQLDPCINVGDPGDPWPGSTNARRFNFHTNPPANWYAQNRWTGIDILDVQPDGAGSVAVEINWVPTSIPGLRFLNPPGGVSIPGSQGVERYPVNFVVTDVFGGTTVRLYYIRDERSCSVSGTPCADDSACSPGEFCRHDTPVGTANFIGGLEKTTPGVNELSIDWNIADLDDGRYVVFAELIPGQGADGTERDFSLPRPGRNNVGDGTLTLGTCVARDRRCNQDTDCNPCIDGRCLDDNRVCTDHEDCATISCSIPPNAVDIAGHMARSEAWSVVCTNVSTQEWAVYSTLTQPEPDDLGPGDVPPYPLAMTGHPYASVNGEVTFIINAGPEQSFLPGDSFSFVTTGKTAVSGSVTIEDGKVKQDPTARITAYPLSGDPPLEVNFDGRSSTDPNGEPLLYLWNFGDGSTPTVGAQTTHLFAEAGSFTVVLRVTNQNNLRFGVKAVDIDVTNNRPTAIVSASPTSGPPSAECEALGFCTLTVVFNGAQSTDMESDASELVYQWDYGDGLSANDTGMPGTNFMNTTHFYSQRGGGAGQPNRCTNEIPCDFIVTLTVTDPGGKSHSDTIAIMVGNSVPVPYIEHSALQGADPLTVFYDASGSSDPDGDDLEIEWVWGDGTPNEKYGPGGPNGDGVVPHLYVLPQGTSSSSFETKALFRDLDDSGHERGGETSWGPVTVDVHAEPVGASDPTACFHICEEAPCYDTELGLTLLPDESFTVDANCSHDNPPGGQIASYSWDFGDDTTVTGKTQTHAYAEAGTYAITLTVADAEDPPNSSTTWRAISVNADGTGPETTENEPPIAVFVVTPEAGYAGATLFTFDAGGSTDPDGPTDSLSYRWNFGDGFHATGMVATHIYEDPDADGYIVRLTVRDEENAPTDAMQLVVVKDNAGNLPPFAYIATGLRTGTAPATLTFDGRNSFDLNDDPIEFTWEFKKDGQPHDTLTGGLVTKLFEEAGTYTVELTVDDRRGGIAHAGPETIVITARSAGPGDDGDDDDQDEEPEQPIPSTGLRFCGLGMLMSLFGSLLGLTAMAATRRRFHL